MTIVSGLWLSKGNNTWLSQLSPSAQLLGKGLEDYRLSKILLGRSESSESLLPKIKPQAAVVEESRSSRSSELITGIDSRVNKLDRKSKIYHNKLDDQFIDRFEN
jgi:lipase chaperone LimK